LSRRSRSTSGAGLRAQAPAEVIVMNIDLDQARRRAKELLRAARAGNRAALAQLRADRAPRLADAQHAIARQLGFASWPALSAHVEAVRGDREDRRRRLVHSALGGRPDRVEALLAHDPGLARAGLDAALVLGDVEAVAAALDRDPQLLARDASDTAKRPLSCCCHSVCLRPQSARADALLATIRLLLARGADPNEVHHNEYGAMSVLYGAAGVAHNPDATRVLLESGADPDDGESVYHACEAPDTTCLEILLDAGATVRATNALNNALRDAGKVRILLEHGDLRPSDPELRDALLHAIHDSVAELLIEHGAALDARDGDGLTPYARAVRRGDTSLAALLEPGAATDVDPVADWLGAVLRGDREHVARCLSADPELPSRLRPSDAELLPMWASAGEDAGVARLLDAGVPLDARGIDEGTALHYAGMWGRGSTVALLLARGAHVDLMGGPRFAPGTALDWTAWGSRELPGAAERLDGYLEAARLLVDAGARVTDGMVDKAADDVALLLEEMRGAR
jgi:ankyrin repeat protein